VLNRFPTRTRPSVQPRNRLRWLAGFVIVTVTSPLARASVLSAEPDCRATGGDWSCYLPGIFRFLLVIAIILGVVLTAVIFLAVKSYRKNKDDEKVGS
jgi:hypothetical protein